MLRTIAKMISRYGTPMTLVQNGQEIPIRAFFQETKSKSQGSAEREFVALGEVPKGLFVYIGPVTPEAEAGNTLLWRQREFELRRAEVVMVGEKAAYCWGLCVEKGGADQWSTNL